MIIIVATLALFAIVVVSAVDPNSDMTWISYKKKFAKVYPTPSDELYRRTVFEANMASVVKREQQRNPFARFGVTPFSDWTEEEFRANMLAGNERAIATGLETWRRGKMPHLAAWGVSKKNRTAIDEIPPSIDWRTRGAVTPVKNQGICGSCWAFSTIGSIEGQWFLAADRPLTSFAEQNLVSCDDLLSFGCNGGFSWVAYSYLVDAQNGSVYTEASWPYVSANGSVPACPANKAAAGHKVGGAITGGVVLAPWDAEGMKLFLASRGPLSVAVDATSFQTYVSGIMTAGEGLLPNHEVLVVGYSSGVPANATEAVAYWIIKNSWGTSWGEEGYIRLELGKNLCLVELLPNSATVL
jgi:cysteine peptidase B